MSQCIYCLALTTGAEGLAHIIPEALLQNPNVLPAGAVCDGCNGYAGSHLDDALLYHPMIGAPIQILGTPGKRGRPRDKIAGIEHQPADDPQAQARGPALVFSDRVERGGKRKVEVTFRPHPRFDMWVFRRALHNLAFLAYAQTAGIDAALDVRWNSLRRYIRAAQRSERRPFSQVTPVPGEMPPTVRIGPLADAGDHLVGIAIFGTLFAVDLLNTGALEPYARFKGWVYVGPEERNPIGLKIEGEEVDDPIHDLTLGSPNQG